MSITHGGPTRRKIFTWRYDRYLQTVYIVNENDKQHSYSISEIHLILLRLRDEFGNAEFPLANNVEYLGNGTEQMGLGRIVLELDDSDINHAQGSSYLGVVLEEIGYLKWNGLHRGIKWKLISDNLSVDEITKRLLKDKA